jgi:hypothetical protein
VRRHRYSGAAAVVASAALRPHGSACVPLRACPPVPRSFGAMVSALAPRGRPYGARGAVRRDAAARTGCRGAVVPGERLPRAGFPGACRRGGLKQSFAPVIFALPFHSLSSRWSSPGASPVRWPPGAAAANRASREETPPRTPGPPGGRGAGGANRVVASTSFTDVSQGIQAQSNVGRDRARASANDAAPEPRRTLEPPHPVSPASPPAVRPSPGGRGAA